MSLLQSYWKEIGLVERTFLDSLSESFRVSEPPSENSCLLQRSS
jgi:hypothetical protein